MHPVIPYVTAALLFGLGVYGVLRRRNAILVLMAVELMLNAVNLIFVTADVTLPAGGYGGGVFALFVIVLAAAEVGVGLAIVLQYYRMRHAVAVDEVRLDGTPNNGPPNGGAPNDGPPNGGAPNDGPPNGGAPNDGTPIGGAPNDGTPHGGPARGGEPEPDGERVAG